MHIYIPIFKLTPSGQYNGATLSSFTQTTVPLVKELVSENHFHSGWCYNLNNDVKYYFF